MPFKLVALDLDGTVVGPDLTIHADVRAAIRAAQEHGVIVVIATGRVYAAALPFVQLLGIGAPVICFQGAAVRDPRTGTALLEHRLPAAPARRLIELLLAESAYPVASLNDRLYVTRMSDEFDIYQHYDASAREQAVIAPNMAEVVEATPPLKVLFAGRPAVVAGYLTLLEAELGGQLGLVRSHEFFGEATAPGISKGSALAELADRFGIPREQTLAIGDERNDIEMLQWAGLGLAMGNANCVVQQAADAVIPSVAEAGVAWALRRYVLDGASGA
jgi:Cof subfamily protein (haloacid dehalogenase superfamily)